MSGHRSSRRRDYGRRQKDVRDAAPRRTAIDLDGPATWARGRAWAHGPERQPLVRQARSGERPSGAERSVGGQGR